MFEGEQRDFGFSCMDFEVCLRCLKDRLINFSETEEKSRLGHSFMKYLSMGL